MPDTEFLERMKRFSAEPCKCHPNPQTIEEGEPCCACTSAGILKDFADEARRGLSLGYKTGVLHAMIALCLVAAVFLAAQG